MLLALTLTVSQYNKYILLCETQPLPENLSVPFCVSMFGEIAGGEAAAMIL